MSFTRPMPLNVPFASACALRMTFVASATAVSKPKLGPTNCKSLSIVLGTPTTDILRLRRVHSSATSRAHLSVPSPPMQNRMFMFMRTSVSTISSVGCCPRDEPRIVPPCSWIVSTVSGSSMSGW